MLVASALTLEGVFQNRSPTSAYFQEAEFKFSVAKPRSHQQYGACSRFEYVCRPFLPTHTPRDSNLLKEPQQKTDNEMKTLMRFMAY